MESELRTAHESWRADVAALRAERDEARAENDLWRDNEASRMERFDGAPLLDWTLRIDAKLHGMAQLLVARNAELARQLDETSASNYEARTALARVRDLEFPLFQWREYIDGESHPSGPDGALITAIDKYRVSKQTPLMKIVQDAATRFDERPDYRASVEARAEIARASTPAAAPLGVSPLCRCAPNDECRCARQVTPDEAKEGT